MVPMKARQPELSETVSPVFAKLTADGVESTFLHAVKSLTRLFVPHPIKNSTPMLSKRSFKPQPVHNMKTTINLLLAIILTVLFCSIAKAQIPNYSNSVVGATLLYSNAFDQGTGNITNTYPDYAVTLDGATNGVKWVDALGTANTNQFSANGQIGTPQGDAILLPFGVQSNFVYTIVGTVTFTGNPGNWLGAGFANYDKIIGGSNDRFNSGGVDWSLLTQPSGNVQAYGVNATGQYCNENNAFAITGTHTVKMVLDTTFNENSSNRWIATCYMDGQQVVGAGYPGEYIYPTANPTILGVGFDQNALTAGAQNQVVWNAFLLFANPLPEIPIQPSSVSANQAASATFQVVAAGTPPFAYQWYTNGVALANGGGISGANTNILTITGLLPSSASTNFYCVVTNVYGAVTSAPASLTVYSSPQFLTADPVTYTNPMTLFGGITVTGTNYLGSSPTFSVYSPGLQPVGYFWFTNGVAVGGATGATFTLTNCVLTSPTNFTCIASNSLGKATNTWVAQYIPTPTAPYPQQVIADAPVGYWRLDDTNVDGADDNNGDGGYICNDFMSGNNGFYTNVLLAQSGYYVLANGIDVTNDPNQSSVGLAPAIVSTGSDANSIGTNIDFSGTPNGEFSISIWANGGKTSQGYGVAGAEPVNGGIFVKGYYGTEEYGLDDGGSGGAVRFFVRNGVSTVISASSTLQLGGTNSWHHLVGVCDESNGVINLFVDGLLTAQSTLTKNSGLWPEPTAPLTIGANPTPGTGLGDHQFEGALDDAAIFNYPLSSSQVIQLYQAAGGAVSLNLVAPLPPTNAVWRQNTTLTIPAFAVGAPPLGYYWTNVTAGGILGGANIKGGSGVSAISTLTATLTITNAPPSYSGEQLELVVTNASGSTNWFTTLFSYPPPITIGYTNSILYSNAFNGGTWNLAGTASTVENSLVGGTNTTWVDALGTNDTGSMEGSGLDNSTLGDSWLLPFTPEPGFVYTLTASAYMTAYTGSSWIGAGFAGPITNNAVGAARFADADIYGYDFIIWVNTSGNVQYLEGPGATLYITNVNNFYPTTLPMTITAQVVLDTTGPQWVQYAFLNGVPCGTNTFASNPPIGSVGITQTGIGNPNSVIWTNFALTAVSPNGFPPYLLAPLPPTNSISTTNTTITVAATGYGTGPWGYYWLNNSTVVASGVTNSTAPNAANLSVAGSSLSSGSLELVLTNAIGTNITVIPLTSPFPTTGAPITYGVTNGVLYLSWPANYTGAQLQAQTNSLTTGIGTNWVNINPGGPSTATNLVGIPINVTNGAVFFRWKH
jgi:hypothetical protein